MGFEELKAAILSGDPAPVAAEMASWSEAERKQAVPPLHQLIEELKRLPIDDPQLRGRQYQASQLALLGTGSAKEVPQNRVWGAQEHELPVLLDRRPPWLKKYALKGYQRNVEGWDLLPWSILFEAGLVEWDDENELQVLHVATRLPKLMQQAPDRFALLREQIPLLGEIHYRVPSLEMWAMAKTWGPFIEQQAEAGTLDRIRFLQAVLGGLNLGFNRNHQQDCIALVECARPSAEDWAAVLTELLSLLQHESNLVIGFVVDQVKSLHDTDQLDREAALPALSSVFHVKQKKYATSALKIAAECAAIPEHRTAAVQLATAGLQHPAADVQKKALKILSDRLGSDDAETIVQLRTEQDSVAATVQPELLKLLDSLAEPTDLVKPVPVVQDSDLDLAAFEQQLETLPKSIRALLDLEESLEAARRDSLSVTCVWPVMSGRMLAAAEPIAPIESLDELIDTVAAALERLDSPDEYNRMLDGLTRFAGELPDDFATRTAALRKRAVGGADPPRRGLLRAWTRYGSRFMLEVWLTVPDNLDEFDFSRSDSVGKLQTMVTNCLFRRESRQLLSTPTHSGGWIDPAVWASRLQTAAGSGVEVDEYDFAISALRLAPDGRRECLPQIEGLAQPWRDLATCLLSNDTKLAKPTRREALWLNSPIMFDWHPAASPEVFPLATQVAETLETGLNRLSKPTGVLGFKEASLNNPGWFFPWQATIWPGELDWYWLQATKAFAERVGYQTKSDEPHSQYLQPLFATDRPLTLAAARALWVATLSQDSSRTVAIDVWIELISTARSDIGILVAALHEVMTAGDLPAKRIVAALTQVAQVSPLHAWLAAEMVQHYLVGLEGLPRDVSAFLSPLLEWLTQLGLPVYQSLHDKLATVGGGKAKQLANELTALRRTPSSARDQAVHEHLDARFARATRFARS